MSSPKDVRDIVRKAYGGLARKMATRKARRASCCAPVRSVSATPVPEAELGLSCGDPLAFCGLKRGEVVLDLGSGAGKDVFAAAQKVGPAGRAIGVDMTPDMIALARRNAVKFKRATGLSNVEFHKGPIENLPAEDDSVDVVVSNCVINLSPDKPKVFREAFRVLRPGGRLVVSDIVLNRPLPASARANKTLYVACVAGAMLKEDYLKAIREAGFKKLEVLRELTYDSSGDCADPVTKRWGKVLQGIASSITVRATKGSQKK